MKKDYLSDATQRLVSVADVAYTAGCGLNTSNPWGAVTTYPPAWLATYMKLGYQKHDPVLNFMCSGKGAINWRDLPGDETSLAVMKHAQEFGLLHGTVFSNVIEGRKCSVSVCHTKEELTAPEIDVLREYTTIYGILKPRPGSAPKDEVCLRYLDLQAHGASAPEVQSVLGLSARSIAELKKEAIHSMDAKTLPQAISSAIEANLI